MTWMLAVTLLASAQTRPEAQFPALDTRLFRPNFDSHSALWAESAGEIGADGFGGRAMLGWLREPVVFRIEDGSKVNVVEDALLMEILGAWRYDRFRVGVDLPVWLLASSDIAGGTTGLGNVAVDGRVTLVDYTDAPVGVAVSARFGLPTPSAGSPLGVPAFTGQILAIATAEVDRTQLHANVGPRFLPDTRFAGGTFGDEVTWALGGGYLVADQTGLSLDLAGNANLAALRSGATSVPIEALVGAWARVNDLFVVRGGVGRGVTPGIGAPAGHVLTVLSYEPALAPDTDHDGLVDADDDCPADPEDLDRFQDLDGCPDGDNDQDTIADAADACPLEPEDFDTWEDVDGCPDLSHQVVVRVVDPDGVALPDAQVHIVGPATALEGKAGALFDLHDGEYVVGALARRYVPAERTVAIARDAPGEIVVTLDPALTLGTLELAVQDRSENVLDGFVEVGGREEVVVDGRATIPLPEGAYELIVSSPGYTPATVAVDVVADEITMRTVRLRAPRVVIHREQIEIKEAIYFETAKAKIKAESDSLLREIAAAILEMPGQERIRIEGHTDSRGSETYNLDLSQRRAAAVLTWLVENGVPAERLTSVGYGEARPLDDREVPEAWEKNRRVDFFIEQP